LAIQRKAHQHLMETGSLKCSVSVHQFHAAFYKFDEFRREESVAFEYQRQFDAREAVLNERSAVLSINWMQHLTGLMSSVELKPWRSNVDTRPMLVMQFPMNVLLWRRFVIQWRRNLGFF
jgi:hypothetical protein